MEDEDDDRRQPSEKKSSFVIKIPSYQEVINNPTQSQAPPPSLFTPSPSFSQAFNFIKNSEFYSPPPAPPPFATASQASEISAASSSSFRPLGNEPGILSSSSSVASSLTSSQIANNRNAILVGQRQKGNPLLKHIRNVRWAFADVVCDYMLGQSTCALYLSLRYHLLHPDYLYYRIRELPKNFKLRVVLCHVDVEDVVKPLLEVTKTALLHDSTLLCGWSLEECGRYLETIKVYENKPADIIQGQMDTDYLSRLNHALTTVRHVNKTDVVTLGSTFGTLSHIMDASMEDLARCPGIGERKVKRLYDAFHEPFKRVVPKHLPIPETSGHNKFEPTSDRSKGEKEEDAKKHTQKESETTIKSALSAAFAKYSDKIGKKNNNPVQEKIEESSTAVEEQGQNRSCSEEAGS